MKKVLNKYNNFTIDASLFFKLLFEDTEKISILILSANGIILECNTAFLQIFGYNKDELTGEYFSLLFTEDDKKKNVPELELGIVLSRGATGDNNFLLHKDGSPIWVYGESVLAKAEKDFIIKIIFNIDQQKKLEQFLASANIDLQKPEGHSSETNRDLRAGSEQYSKSRNEIRQLLAQNQNKTELYETILSNATDFIYCFDLKGRFIYVNNALLQLWGIRLEQAIGKTFKELNYPEELVQKHRRQIEKVISYKEPIRDENIYSNEKGTRYYEYIFVPVMKDNEVTAIAGITRDITQRYELQQELISTNEDLISVNQDLDNFVYTASHDLKAPINNIEGLFDALEAEISEPSEETDNLVQMIHSSLEKFQHTLSDLSKTARQRLEDVEEVDLAEMIEETKVNLHDLILKFDPIITENVKKAPTIRFSRNNVRSILHNLISNAIKYHSPERRPEVKIETERTDEYFILTVSDNGLGIKDVDKEKVFKMYNRLHLHVEGSGVGMAIVARIVDINGGKIEIESKEGEGSTFKVFLKF